MIVRHFFSLQFSAFIQKILSAGLKNEDLTLKNEEYNAKSCHLCDRNIFTCDMR